MAEQTIILCPGQGAQHVGMGRDFVESSAAAAEFFERADEASGGAISRACFEGPEDVLNQTDVAQPAIFTTSVAAMHAAATSGGKVGSAILDDVAGYAGLSLGEYTALHFAGVFDFNTGLKLVSARGRYMQEAAVATPSSMVSIIGAGDEEVETLCADAADGAVLVPANYNSPGQIVVSGTIAACDRAVTLAGERGFRAIPLKVAGAFHSPIMQPAADRLAEDLEQVEFQEPRKTVWANTTAEPHGDPESIKAELVKQITEPVRWSQTMAKLADDHSFVELAPGRVLSGLLKKVNRRAPITNLGTAENLKKANEDG